MWEFIVRVLLGLFLMVVAIKDLISKNIPMDSDTLYYSFIHMYPLCKALTLLDRILGYLLD